MKYAMCPHCGRKICRGEPGTKVELECPKCGKPFSVIIDDDELRICEKPLVSPVKAAKQQA
jgi:Zn finger protein HypA/HybF involved in hydrogenase expression